MEELIETNLIDKLDKPSRPSETSQASAKAKKLGLTYLGFGRYGVVNKDRKTQVTHVVKRDNLIPVAKTNFKYDKKTGRETAEHKPEPVGKEFASWKMKFGKKHEKDVAGAKKVADDYVLGPQDSYDLHSHLEDKIGPKLAKIQKNNANLYQQAGTHKIKGIFRILDEFTNDTDDVNKHLYTGKSPNREEERMATWKIRSMDALFAKPEFKAHHDYTVYTGTKANLKPGKDYLFKGYLSTSLTPSTAHDFVDSDKNTYPTIIQIDIKKGQKVMDINAIYDAHRIENPKKRDMIGNQYESEMEHLLPRGSKLKVTEGPFFMDDIQYFRAEIVTENEDEDDE